MDIASAFAISAAGMNVQSARLRVVAENLANAQTTADSPGGDPYRRKVITFSDRLDATTGAALVAVKSVSVDPSDFPLKYDPSHPGANAQGYVKMPNVDTFVETLDMREAQQSYNANLEVLQVTRTMLNRTIDMLK
jgi:flagellar basal-body rod protein FlgC